MATGHAVVDFGSAPGGDTASVAVTGQAAILATSFVEAWIDPTQTATVDHSVDEHIMAAALFGISCSAIVAGTGFTINATTQYGKVSGKFNIAWVWT
jgi:hypothetical protein